MIFNRYKQIYEKEMCEAKIKTIFIGHMSSNYPYGHRDPFILRFVVTEIKYFLLINFLNNILIYEIIYDNIILLKQIIEFAKYNYLYA